MKKRPKFASKLNRYFRTLVSIALVSGGLFQLALPAFAAGTAAGTSITNTATGTYEDPSQPGTTINTTSNTVTVTVAPVAGITNRNTAIIDSTPATGALPGDTLTYDFLITNTGNAPTTISIPAPVIVGPGTLGAAGITYDIDLNGDGVLDTTAGTLAQATAAVLLPGGTIKAHVPILIDTLATSGAPLSVRLGDTGPNDNTAATQEQPVSGTNNVQTNTTGAVNGQREASAVGTVNIASNVVPQAFATLLKTSGLTDVNNTPSVLNDDVITYNLQLRVENAPPSGATGYTVSDLAGTSINIDGTATNAILVSDVVPALTTLNATPNAPTGWTVVYSTDNTSTLTAVNAAANPAAGGWTATAPALNTVKRVGFVKTGAGVTVTKGTTVTGFNFQVMTTGLNASTGGTVYNIAQALGTTSGTTNPVYDESGDQNPSNFNDDGTPGNTIPTTGVANPSTDGVDPNNINTGTGPGGEDNVVNVVRPGSVLNGPNGFPGAVGPTDNNDDFTNKTVTNMPANSTATFDPTPVSFVNTVGNPSASSPVNNVLIRPYVSSTTTTDPGYSNVLDGTTVTITDPVTSTTAVYTYNPPSFPTANNFVLTSGTQVKIASIPASGSAQYNVVVDLPAGAAQNTGYSVPISAFVDAGTFNSIPDAGEIQNRTIDRVWTGYVKLVKEVQILETDGTTVVQPYTQTPNAAFNNDVRPGRFLQYRVTYTNLSQNADPTTNVILNANKIVITEDGVNAALGNTWGKDQDNNGIIDTSNVVNSTSDSKGGIITYFNTPNPATPGTFAATVDTTGTTPQTDVTKYVDTLPPALVIAPQQSGVLTFKRKIN